MEDDRADEKRWDDLADQLIEAYGIIRTVLSYLPLKIQLEHYNRDWRPTEMIAALAAINRARVELIRPQPLGERHLEMLQAGILDWLLAYDIAGLFPHTGDPGGWRLDGLEHLIRRAENTVGRVAEDLGIGE